ncbi:MAG: hypothetical protein ACI9C3_001875, partial [Yoonia sp.]
KYDIKNERRPPLGGVFLLIVNGPWLHLRNGFSGIEETTCESFCTPILIV